MHKHIVVCGDPGVLRELASELPALDGIVSLAIQQGASVSPPGDVLTVYTLNSTADDVLRKAAPAAREGRVRVVLGESRAFISAAHHELIAKDDDEALWEEMESQLRNHGRVSTNYLLLMFLGGAVSAGAFTLDPVGQAIATVGASIASPGFEPLAKVSQGLVLRRRTILVHGALSAVVGYVVLMGAAALTFAALTALGEAHHADLTTNAFAKSLTTFTLHGLLPSLCAAVAGGVMVASLRDTYVVGPLMILALIPAAALVGASVATGDFALAMTAAARGALDGGSVIVAVALVLLWKQKTKHRRSLLP